MSVSADLLIPIYTPSQSQQALAELLSPQTLLSEASGDLTVAQTVAGIIADVRQRGDEALYEMASRFGDDLKQGQAFILPKEALQTALNSISSETRVVLEESAQAIRDYAKRVMASLPTSQIWQQGELEVGFSLRPVSSVACYVPGGRYPLASTALMTVLSAKAAGVKRVIMLCPKPSPEVLAAALIAGVDEVYLLGGAQAVAAVAYGTQSVEKVSMLVGPGNAYVAEAKRQLIGTIGIDMLAGPSEVTVVADSEANAEWVAADLLAQAEHDPDARVYLLTDSEFLAQAVQKELYKLAEKLGLPDFVTKEALPKGALLVFETIKACVEAANALAPEHLHLHLKSPEPFLPLLTDYGTLFIGPYATVPLGDYSAGPNHTLPTGRAARFSGALSPMSYLRFQQAITGLEFSPNVAATTQAFAHLEGLTAHAYAAGLRA